MLWKTECLQRIGQDRKLNMNWRPCGDIRGEECINNCKTCFPVLTRSIRSGAHSILISIIAYP